MKRPRYPFIGGLASPTQGRGQPNLKGTTMRLNDHGALLDVGLVAVGGGAIGGLVDTVPLMGAMAALLAARAVAARHGKAVPLTGAAFPAPLMAGGAGGRLHWPRMTGAWRRRPQLIDLDGLPELTVVPAQEDDPNLAVIDALTGLPNRRGLERLLDEECAKAARRSAPVAVLVLSVRDAGQVRRLYGPQAARDVLRKTGERLRVALGDAGTVGRWAGEEFVVVVPGLRPQAAPLLAERYRRVLEAEPVRLSSGRLIPVAMGAGWAASPRDGISGQFLVTCAQGRAAARSAEARVLAMG